MVFSSAVFILLFFPITFILNYFIKKEYSNALLLIASLIFYAWGEPIYVLLMMVSIIINWTVSVAICKARNSMRKGILLIGIVCDLGILGYYKYAAFFASMINAFFRRTVISEPQLTLPIGISFFTFQAISYIIDVYRDKEQGFYSLQTPRLTNTALYISFFPQLIAGPIVKYKDINRQIIEREITGQKIAFGFKRFIYGLSKKILISNVLGMCADTVFSYDIAQVDGKAAWIGIIAYTFQIYYDFSGYSDMAIGLGKMFGFDIPENFDYPYLSKSITEFWRRWHISLGSWFREYVYIPLGGNRKGGAIRTYVNLLIVFFLTGLWHGADVSFIVWGLYHGLFSIIERIGLRRILNKNKVVAIFYCLTVVTFGWVFFRADNTVTAVAYILRMIMPWMYMDSNIPIGNYMDNKTIFVAICAFGGMGVLKTFVPSRLVEKWKGSIGEALYCVVLLVLCLSAIASNTYNPFIYFQF